MKVARRGSELDLDADDTALTAPVRGGLANESFGKGETYTLEHTSFVAFSD